MIDRFKTSILVLTGISQLFLFSCQVEDSNDGSVEIEKQQASQAVSNDRSWLDFQTGEGDCVETASIIINIGAGEDKQMDIQSVYALNKVTITSKKGDELPIRDGFTLFIGDYLIDSTAVGANPLPEQVKIEMTFITQDKTEVGTGIYFRTAKSNLAVGPNLFYNGKAYPMKNNFEGGVYLTEITNDYICGEIKLLSKFDVKIDGTFKAKLLKKDLPKLSED